MRVCIGQERNEASVDVRIVCIVHLLLQCVLDLIRQIVEFFQVSKELIFIEASNVANVEEAQVLALMHDLFNYLCFGRLHVDRRQSGQLRLIWKQLVPVGWTLLGVVYHPVLLSQFF